MACLIEHKGSIYKGGLDPQWKQWENDRSHMSQIIYSARSKLIRSDLVLRSVDSNKKA